MRKEIVAGLVGDEWNAFSLFPPNIQVETSEAGCTYNDMCNGVQLTLCVYSVIHLTDDLLNLSSADFVDQVLTCQFRAVQEELVDAIWTKSPGPNEHMVVAFRPPMPVGDSQVLNIGGVPLRWLIDQTEDGRQRSVLDVFVGTAIFSFTT